MVETSAGILLYRRAPGLEVFLAHMGGPFWARKDAAAWSIPKGVYVSGEEPLAAALREFSEEVGAPAPDEPYELLGEFRQPSGKRLTVFAGDEKCLAPIRTQLKLGGEGVVSFIVIRDAGRKEYEIELKGKYRLTPELTGSIKAMDGVVDARLS